MQNESPKTLQDLTPTERQALITAGELAMVIEELGQILKTVDSNPASNPSPNTGDQETMPTTNPEIEKRFTYHPPKEGQPEKYMVIREGAKDLAYWIMEFCPESRERSLALTKLEEAVMRANAAIARNT